MSVAVATVERKNHAEETPEDDAGDHGLTATLAGGEPHGQRADRDERCSTPVEPTTRVPDVGDARRRSCPRTTFPRSRRRARRIEQPAWTAFSDRLRATLGPPSRAPKVDPSSVLTAREREVLHLLGEPLSMRAIARKLCASVDTVRAHLKAIYRQLGVHSRDQAVDRAGIGRDR